MVPSKLDFILSVYCIIFLLKEVGSIEDEVAKTVTVKIVNIEKNPYRFLGNVEVSDLLFESAILLERRHATLLRFCRPSILQYVWLYTVSSSESLLLAFFTEVLTSSSESVDVASSKALVVASLSNVYLFWILFIGPAPSEAFSWGTITSYSFDGPQVG